MNNQKKTIFIKVINKSVMCKLFKNITSKRKKAHIGVLFRSSTNFLNKGTIDEIFLLSCRQNLFKNILKKSANMYKS